jgi:hypothetical protein
MAACCICAVGEAGDVNCPITLGYAWLYAWCKSCLDGVYHTCWPYATAREHTGMPVLGYHLFIEEAISLASCSLNARRPYQLQQGGKLVDKSLQHRFSLYTLRLNKLPKDQKRVLFLMENSEKALNRE